MLFFLSNFPPTTPYAPHLPSPPPSFETAVFLPPHRKHDHQDPRLLLGPSSGKRIFKGRFAEGSTCPPKVAVKIRDRATGGPVGTHRLMMATQGEEGGLPGALKRAAGLAGLGLLFEECGAEIRIDHDQIGGDATVVESTLGQCNNRERSFHEEGADMPTARAHRALRAAVPITMAKLPLIQKNGNNGGCEQTVDKDGNHNCRLQKDYPEDQVAAARQIDSALYNKVEQDCPTVRIIVEHCFGNYDRRKHTEDDKPVVTERVVGDGLTLLRATGLHFCQIPGSAEALRRNVEVRLALNVQAKRKLGSPSANYNDLDLTKGMADVLEILATCQEESLECRKRLDAKKTADLVRLVDALREKSLEDFMDGVQVFSDLYGGRGFSAESGSVGGELVPGGTPTYRTPPSVVSCELIVSDCCLVVPHPTQPDHPRSRCAFDVVMARRARDPLNDIVVTSALLV